jgi:hypothetical protein
MPETPTFGRYAEIPYEQMIRERQEGYRSLIKTRGALGGPNKIWAHNPKLAKVIGSRSEAAAPRTARELSQPGASRGRSHIRTVPRTGGSPKSETGRHARDARFVLGIATADNEEVPQ